MEIDGEDFSFLKEIEGILYSAEEAASTDIGVNGVWCYRRRG